MKKNTAPLAKARISAGLKQGELAQKAQITTLHLLRVERGTVPLSDTLRQRLSKALGISEDAIARKHSEARKQWAKSLHAS